MTGRSWFEDPPPDRAPAAPPVRVPLATNLLPDAGERPGRHRRPGPPAVGAGLPMAPSGPELLAIARRILRVDRA